jgi:uncharacterized protein YdhG (YjbR/CyaY superfamily)
MNRVAMKPRSKPATIDDYLAGVEPGRRAALQRLRRTIRTLVPEAEECITYSIPAFRCDGRVVAGFAATKSGCSYFPFSGRTLEALDTALRSYDRTKSSLHFDPAKGLPTALVRKLLRTRLAERR